MGRQASLALACSALVAASPAPAQVAVSGNSCGSIPAASYTVIPLGGDHYDVELHTLYSPQGDSIFEIRPMWAGIAIDHLTIEMDGPVAGSPVTVRVISKCGDSSTKFRTVSSILQTGTAEVTVSKVDVAEDIGSVEVMNIGDFTAGRDILGPITATTPDNSARGINKLFATRSILGDVNAPNGRIVWLSTVNGDFGSPKHFLQIQAKYGVTSINCSVGDVYVNANTRAGGGSGTISFIQARKFFGTVETAALAPVTGTGGFPGEFRIHQQFNGRISLGSGFAAPNFMLMPLGGFTGQMVINADNVPGGAWTGPITFRIGTTPQFTLNGPNYAQTAATLGGGSIGAAPFGLHSSSCSPANNSVLAVGGCGSSTSPSVRLRHYGPISWTGSSPVAISRRPASTTGAFSSVPASNFVYSPVPGDLNSLQVMAIPGAAIGFNPGFEYRIQPQGSLVSAGVAGTPPVPSYDYRVTVTGTGGSGGGGNCPADFDCSGAVNGIDLSTLLAQWGPCTGACSADLDHNSIVNGIDLSMLLAGWGACPPGGGAAGGGKR